MLQLLVAAMAAAPPGHAGRGAGVSMLRGTGPRRRPSHPPRAPPLSPRPRTQALRTIKGILNKLTPEKFERLLQQLLEVITTADVLRHTITLVFENAVEQPTYCAMYADLCMKVRPGVRPFSE